MTSESKIAASPPPEAIIPPHQWTRNTGEVLIIKCTDADGCTRNEIGDKKVVFQYPETVGEVVSAPDWNPAAKCGGGLHGWPWGRGIGDGKDPDYVGRWYVFGVKPEDIVGQLDGGMKCKFRTGVVRYIGQWAGALSFTLQGRMALDAANSRGSASNSGDRGSASNSGDRGTASNSGYSGSASNSGDRGSASNSGYSGSASNSGYSGSASNSGDSGSASNSGYSGSASTTAKGTAAVCTGLYSKAKAAEFGCIALAWWNPKEERVEMRCSLVSPCGPLKADVFYRLNDETGEFEESL